MSGLLDAPRYRYTSARSSPLATGLSEVCGCAECGGISSLRYGEWSGNACGADGRATAGRPCETCIRIPDVRVARAIGRRGDLRSPTSSAWERHVIWLPLTLPSPRTLTLRGEAAGAVPPHMSGTHRASASPRLRGEGRVRGSHKGDRCHECIPRQTQPPCTRIGWATAGRPCATRSTSLTFTPHELSP